MKQSTKRLTVLILSLCFLCSLLVLTSLSAIAEPAEAPTGMTLALTDDFSKVGAEERLFEQTGEWTLNETCGYIRATSETQSIVYSFAETEKFGGVAQVNALIWSEGGKGGNDYRESVDSLFFVVYTSTDGEVWASQKTANSAVEASDTDVLFKTTATVERGAKYVKLEFKAVGANNSYSLGFKQVDIFAYSADTEKEIVTDATTTTAGLVGFIDATENWIFNAEHPEIGYYRADTSVPDKNEAEAYLVYGSSESGFEGFTTFEVKVYFNGDPSFFMGNVIKPEFYVGDSVDSFSKLDFKVDGSGAVKLENTKNSDTNYTTTFTCSELGANMKYFKITFNYLGVANNYTQGILSVKLNGTISGNETKTVISDSSESALLSKTDSTISPEGEAWAYLANIGTYRNMGAAAAETDPVAFLIYKVADTDVNPAFLGIRQATVKVGYDDPWRVDNNFKLVFYVSSDGEEWIKIDDTKVTVSDKEATSAGYHAQIEQPSARYLKIGLLYTAAANAWTQGILSVDIQAEYGLQSVVNVESAKVADGQVSEMTAGGASVKFVGEITPANASFKVFTWNVYDDADCTQISKIAKFTEDVLTADHTFDEAQTVYVVGKVGGVSTTVFAMKINPRPAPESVEFAIGNPLMRTEETLTLTATVLPANANDKTLTYEIFADSACSQSTDVATIAENVVTALKSGTFYARAKAANGVTSQAIKVTVVQDVVLLYDDCKDVSKLNQLSTFESIREINGYLMRNYGDAPGPAAGGDQSLIKHPTEYVYKVRNDISGFKVSMLMYASTTDMQASANNNPFRDYNFELFVSADGTQWTYVDTDYTVAEPDAKYEDFGVKASDYAQLTVYNVGAIPEGSRFLKIVFVGVIKVVKDGETESYFYENTLALSQNPDYNGYDSIVGFYNTWSPSLNGVKIYAAPGTVVEGYPIALQITNTIGGLLYKGSEFTVNAKVTMSDNPETPANVTDFTQYKIVFDTEGASNYISATANVISLKDSFNGAVSSVQFHLENADGDVMSPEYTLSLAIPVSSVTISMTETSLKVSQTPYQIGVVVNPENATNASVVVISAELVEGTGSISDYVVLNQGNKTLKVIAGGAKIKIKCTVDGVASNELTLTLKENTTVSITSATSMQTGETLALTATIAPDATLAAVWEIVEGADYATLDGNQLTATKAGAVKIRCTVDGVSAETTVSITTAPKKGCFGVIDLGFGMLALLMAAAVVFKRNK